MKIYLTFLKVIFCILTLTSCNKNIDTQISPKKIDRDLNEYVKKYPNYKENQLSAEKLIFELSKRIDSLAPLNYFDDIAFEILRVKKNTHGKGNMILLRTDKNNSSDTLLSSRVNLNIIAFTENEEIALKLKEGNYYKIKGKKINRINEEEAILISNEIYYSSVPDIIREYPFFRFNIGTFMVVIDSITPSRSNIEILTKPN